ncbi:MAG: mevalonate-3-phosphate 5-kinase [Thermoplasmata archaeon]
MYKPLIAVIGGVPGMGKTSISGYIARNLGIDIVLSSDYLREFIRPFSEKIDGGLIETSVYDAWKFFGEMNSDNIIKGYLKQSAIINEGMNRVISRAAGNGEDLIIETLYFVPSQMDVPGSVNAKICYIYAEDEFIHRKRLEERENYTHKNSSGKRLSAHLFEYRAIMDYTVGECRKYGIKTFDNSDYDRTRNDILEYMKEND